MRFYHVQPQQQYFCGIDLHTKAMYLCVLDQHGAIVLHKNIRTRPEAFLNAIAPYRDGLVVASECIFCWYSLGDSGEEPPCRRTGDAVNHAFSGAKAQAEGQPEEEPGRQGRTGRVSGLRLPPRQDPLVVQAVGALQGQGASSDEPDLGRLDEKAAGGAGSLHAGLDELLRVVELLSSAPGARSVDSSACTTVLLEAVGPSAPSDRNADQARGEPARCDHHGAQQSRSVDDVAHAGDPAGDVELVVEGAGACLGTRAMDRACSTTMNRPVQTCMQGGVGAGGANLPATRLPGDRAPNEGEGANLSCRAHP